MVLLAFDPRPLIHPGRVIAFTCQLSGKIVVGEVSDQAPPGARQGVKAYVQQEQKEHDALCPADPGMIFERFHASLCREAHRRVVTRMSRCWHSDINLFGSVLMRGRDGCSDVFRSLPRLDPSRDPN